MQKGLTSVTPPSSPLKDIFFEFDSYELAPEARAILKTNADWLSAYPGMQIEIEGHTDDVGSDAHNLDLAHRRAQSVARALATDGIDRGRLETEGFGESRPIATNATFSGRAANRRVVLKVVR